MPVKHTADMEKDKFDASGNVKVSVQSAGTGLDVNVTNASNAAVPVKLINENVNIDAEVTAQNQVHDGANFRNQLADTNGRIYTLSKTNYTSTEITALGSSTDISLWLAAYNDGMLLYEYVGSFVDEFEQEAYYTHPSLGDGNKCLKLNYTYTIKNSKKVVLSLKATVTDWTFDSAVQGTVALSLSSPVSPNPQSSIAVGTDVISTVTMTNSGGGTLTLALSGSDASNYRVNNTTTGTTGTSVSVSVSDTVVIETAADFSGSSYSHSVTVTLTNTFYNNTASASFSTSGTFSSFSNLKFWNPAQTVGNDCGTHAWGGTDASSVAKENRTIKLPWHGLGFQRTGGNSDKLGYPLASESWSLSWWMKINSTAFSECDILNVKNKDDNNHRDRINMRFNDSSGSLRIVYFVNRTTGGSNIKVGSTTSNITTSLAQNTFFNVTFVRDASAQTIKMFFNGTEADSNTFANSGMQNIEHPHAFSGSLTTSGYQACWLNTSNTGQRFFFDEISTFNIALSSSQVTSIYNSGTPADLTGHTGLIGWWRCGDGDDGSGNADSAAEGDKIHDMSGNANHMFNRRRSGTFTNY